VAFSPDGKRLATGCDDASVRLWDVASAQPIGAPIPHEKPVGAVAFSPDGKRLATASNDGKVRFWETATSLRIGEVLPHRHEVHALAFSPDGKQVLTGCDDQMAQLWDLATQQRVGPAWKHRGMVRAAAFSPDGKHLATASDTSAWIWSTRPMRLVGKAFQHQGYVHAVAFSPDGKLLLTGSSNAARLWSVATQKEVASSLQQGEMVPSVAFSTDGKFLAIASGSTARLWDVATTLPLGPPLQHRDWVAAVAFSPDGRHLATASKDKTVRLWGVPAPLEGDEQRITLWTQVLTTMEMNEDAVHPLSGRNWEQRQQALAEAGGPASRFHRSIVSRHILHDLQARRHEWSGRWFTAAWHIDRLIMDSPGDAPLYRRRGLVRAHLGRWADADSDFALAGDRNDDIESWYIHALLRLHLGDESGYRRICSLMHDRFRDVTDDAVARWLSLTWSLAPDAVADREWHLGLARRIADRNPHDPSSLEALGIALFRAGMFDRAIEPLSQVVKFAEDYEGLEAVRAGAGRVTEDHLPTQVLQSVINQECAVSSRLFLAMVHGRLGHAEEARRLIQEANLRLGGQLLVSPDDDGGSGVSWDQRLRLARLRREVEQSLKETGISVPDDNHSEDNRNRVRSPTRSDE
jgi:WD40 repeat protein/tetratricopeptide (TPR) repeat protein